MSSTEPSERKLSENPWFWAYLFGVAALVGLFLINNKADQVQAQRDANFTSRQHSLELQAGDPTAVIEPDVSERYVSFTPFYALGGLFTLVAWVMVWRQHFRPRWNRSSNTHHPV